jgi:general stress protein 26
MIDTKDLKSGDRVTVTFIYYATVEYIEEDGRVEVRYDDAEMGRGNLPPDRVEFVRRPQP